MTDHAAPPRPAIPVAAHLLGWAGVLPFAALALPVDFGAWLDEERALIIYGAIILGFMGGVQWGLEMRARHADGGRGYAVSVLPALLAFVAALAPPITGLAMLTAGFLGLFVYDLGRVDRGFAPDWYAALRGRLTLAVTFCLSAALVLRLW